MRGRQLDPLELHAHASPGPTDTTLGGQFRTGRQASRTAASPVSGASDH